MHAKVHRHVHIHINTLVNKVQHMLRCGDTPALLRARACAHHIHMPTLGGGLSVSSYVACCPGGFSAVRLKSSVLCFCWPRACDGPEVTCTCDV